MTLRIVQFGATGQAGRALLRRAAEQGVRVIALDRAQADFSEPEGLAAIAETAAAKADVVIIAAGWTDVDGAETAPETARRVNVDAPAAIAAACAAAGRPLIHISTDYVFDGAKAAAYVETDPARPLNVYGETKLAGERAVLAASPRNAVVRTAWLYDAEGRNFVRTMLALAETRDEVRVVDDQTGSPTVAGDLADALLAVAGVLAGGAEGGLYHYAGAGAATWRTFAEAIFAGAEPWLERRPRVVPVTSAAFGARAARPANSALDCAKFARAFGRAPRPWGEALPEVLAEWGAARQGARHGA